MTDDSTLDPLNDLFHGCAFMAYLELAVECGGVPELNATRRLAYRYYEEALAVKHRQPLPMSDSCHEKLVRTDCASRPKSPFRPGSSGRPD